ncbi:MAG: cytidine deaminase [Crocinitomicaceae bacterium]|nr:cytidine deaminase [Crocinitomicaceae bacterium]
MEKLSIQLEAVTYDSAEELLQGDQELLAKAKDAVKTAYAPYSKFQVGAALRLENGEIISGSNQENVAYPNGLCAERVAFFYAGSKYPGMAIETVAITAEAQNFSMDRPVAPCGSCRQAMLEYEVNQDSLIRVILQGQSGKIMIVTGIKTLLPFHFHEPGLSA